MRYYEFTKGYEIFEEMFNFILKAKLSRTFLFESIETDKFDKFIKLQTLPNISSLIIGQKYYPLVVMCDPNDDTIIYKSSNSACELLAISENLSFSENNNLFHIDSTSKSIVDIRIIPVIFSTKYERDKFISILEFKFGYNSTFISF